MIKHYLKLSSPILWRLELNVKALKEIIFEKNKSLIFKYESLIAKVLIGESKND
jgi:hypothetical protein